MRNEIQQADLEQAKNCPLLKPHIEALCDWCHDPVDYRQFRWCKNHIMSWSENHVWIIARKAAAERDDHRCCRCSRPQWHPSTGLVRLEVRHINPLHDRGYHISCYNHLDNLETLCRDCLNNAQRETRELE